jgi:small-conductance mechanosensitive channel
MRNLSSSVAAEMICQMAQWLPKILLGLVIFLFFFLLSIIIKNIILKISASPNLQRQQIGLLVASIIKGFIVIVGAITALGSMGINVSALVASVGLSGFALSFAMKDALSNLLAGVLVLVYQPFKIGQQIKVAGMQGKVIQMSLRYTHLSGEAQEILIPNSSLLTQNIIIMN